MNAINFIEMGMQNFLSYGNNLTTVDLKFTVPKLIIGQNLDSIVDGQIDSNGSGKTTILNAITYTLYGKPLSKGMKVTDLVNNQNKKDMYTYLIFKVGKTYFKVERFRKNKQFGGTGVKIQRADSKNFKNAKDITPDSTNNINKYIEEHVINMPFEIFSRIVVFSATHKSFLDLPVTSVSEVSQRSILEELFNFLELSEKTGKLKNKIKESNKELEHLEDMQKVYDSFEQKYKAQRDKLKSQIKEWDNENVSKIEKFESDLKELTKIDLKSEQSKFDNIEIINDKIRDKKSSIKDKQSELSLLESELKHYESWKSSYDSDMKKYEEDLANFVKIDFDKETKKINDYNDYLEKLDSVKKDIDKTGSDINNDIKASDKIGKEIKSLQDNKCPYCEQSYDDCAKKVSVLQSEKKELDNSIDKKALSYSKLKKELKELKEKDIPKPTFNNTELATLQANKESIKSNIKSLRKSCEQYKNFNHGGKILTTDSLKSDIKEVVEEVELLNEKLDITNKSLKVKSVNEINEIQSRIDKLEYSLDEAKKDTNPYISMLKDLENENNDETNNVIDEINELSDNIKHYNFLLKLISKNDSFVRKALLRENLPTLNERINHYLKMIGLPHHVSFNEALECVVTQFGKELPHSNLSSGQKARVNIALSFAFRDILQVKHGYVNLCLLDEALDVGLGNVGVQLAAKMIKRVAQENEMSMFVISHRDEAVNLFNDVMSITLKNGFSTIS